MGGLQAAEWVYVCLLRQCWACTTCGCRPRVWLTRRPACLPARQAALPPAPLTCTAVPNPLKHHQLMTATLGMSPLPACLPAGRALPPLFNWIEGELQEASPELRAQLQPRDAPAAAAAAGAGSSAAPAAPQP